MKRNLLIIAAVLACSLGQARAQMLRDTFTVTASTGSTYSAHGQGGGGTTYRVVAQMPAGLTNLSVRLADVDGTTLVESNLANVAAGTNTAWSATWTGTERHGNYTVATKSAARVSTNGSLAVKLITTKEQ